MQSILNAPSSSNPYDHPMRILLDDQSAHLETLALALQAVNDLIDGYEPRVQEPLTKVQTVVGLLHQEVDRIRTRQRQIRAAVDALPLDAIQPGQEVRA